MSSPQSPFAIVVALEREARGFGVRAAAGDCVLLGPRARLYVSGAGAVRASAAAGRALDDGAGTLVSFGYCAALDPELVPGSLLVDSRERATAGAAGPRLGLESSARAEVVDLVKEFERTGPPLSRCAIADTGVVLASAQDKRALRRATGASAADMETRAIFERAGEAGGSAIALRAVSDAADTCIPAWLGRLGADGQPHPDWRAGARDVARRPSALLGVLRLACAVRAADRALRAAAAALQRTV